METPRLGPPERSRQIVSRCPAKIYYVHPAIVGPFAAWNSLFERCRGMVFDHVLSAPIFAPGEAGDIFLTGDPDRAHPAFDSTMGAEELAARLAQECSRHELNLMVDIVIDRVDPNGRLSTHIWNQRGLAPVCREWCSGWLARSRFVVSPLPAKRRIRLTNWDAVDLAAMVSRGTIVDFQG